MLTKNNPKKIVLHTVWYIFAVLLLIYFLLPFYALISRACMTLEEVSSIPAPLYPSGICWENFVTGFRIEGTVNFALALWNSAYIMFLRVIGTVCSSFICAFALSRIRFRGRNILFSAGMLTIMLPGIVTMIPLFTMYSRIGFLNTHLPLWVPTLFGGGMMPIFLEMQFIKSIPKGVDEAAMLDGANYLQIAFLIILPMVMPVLIYQAVNAAIGSWNDFMGPLTYISTAYPEKYTFPLAFFVQFKNASTPQQKQPQVQAAMSLVMMIPTFALFCFFHQQMINGISLGGALKG